MTVMNYVGSRDATDLEHAREEARNLDGTFGKHPPRPESSSAEPKEADQVEGTWYFPPVLKDADEFCAFWEEAPVPEEALARLDRAYDQMMASLSVEDAQGMPKFIATVDLRPVARAAMMYAFSRSMPDDDRRRVLNHQLVASRGSFTVEQIATVHRTEKIDTVLAYVDPMAVEEQRRAEEAAERARDRELRERELALQEREIALQEALLAEQRRANELSGEIMRGTAQISNLTRSNLTGNLDHITGDRIDQVPRARA